jgi:hypothetical protein
LSNGISSPRPESARASSDDGRCDMFGVRHGFDYTNPKGKRIWHPFSLQSLAASEFAEVVNRILDGRYGLLTYRERRTEGGVRTPS